MDFHLWELLEISKFVIPAPPKDLAAKLLRAFKHALESLAIRTRIVAQGGGLPYLGAEALTAPPKVDSER
jgi:hypothetical protein